MRKHQLSSRAATPFAALLVVNFTFWLLVFGLHHRRWITSSEISLAISVALAIGILVWAWLEKAQKQRTAFVFVLVSNFVFWLLMFGLDRRTWVVASEISLATTAALAAIILLWGWLERT